jgi:hypothetical protein
VSLHAQLLRATLTHVPLNVVFIHVKFNTRGIDIIKDMLDQTGVVDKFENNVVYLVSHFDQAENPQETVKNISAEMNKRKMPQQVVFYSNIRCVKENLARTLFVICTNYPKVQIRISEDEFMRKFRIGSLDVLFEK